MKELLNSIYKCLDSKNWYGALLISLTLPDICGFAKYPNCNSKPRYIQWFNKYIQPKYTLKNPFTKEVKVFLTGNDCYALRCSFLHEGVDNIINQKARKVLDEFIFTTTGSHCNYIGIGKKSVLQLDVNTFTKDICDGVEKWLKDIENNKEINEYLSGMLKIHTNGFLNNDIQIL